LPADQLPTEPVLRATLPPPRRPAQPPVCLPFDAPRVRCVTDHGVFVIELDGRSAPNTCTALLAQIAAGLHDRGVFHRVVPDFVVQGGDPRGDGWGGPGYNLRCEYSRRPFLRGTVGIAHSGKDSGGSQWFVCHSPQPHLNGRYTVCGEVIEGLEVIDAIAQGDALRLELVRD
jgi:cyclophilin family peptidyl-prolyl cis-trans isomerase